MSNLLVDRLDGFYVRFKEVGEQITNLAVMQQDMKRYVKLMKEYKDYLEVFQSLSTSSKSQLGSAYISSFR